MYNYKHLTTPVPMYFYLLAASLTANFADSLFGPLYAIYVEGIGGDLLDVGNTVALYSVMTGLLIILIGKLADHFNKALLATIGFALSAIGTLCYLIVQTPAQLYALQIVFAVSTALLSAPLSALFAQYIDKKKAGLLWALEGGGGRIFFVLGLVIGTAVTHKFGFATIFVTIFTFQLFATLFQARVYALSFTEKRESIF